MLRGTCLVRDWLYKEHFIFEHRLPGTIRPPLEEWVIEICVPIDLQAPVSIRRYCAPTWTLTLRPVIGSLTK
jgi:hypothetical protein